MKSSVGLAIALGLSLASGLPAEDDLRVASLPPRDAAAPDAVPGEIIVQFRDRADDADVDRVVKSAGGRRARRSAFGPRFLVGLGSDVSVAEALDRLRELPEVDYAEPNGILRAFQASRPGHFTPNDERYSRQWHFKMLDAERMWGIQKGDSSVVVAVLDTGIAYEDFGPYRKAPDFGTTVFVPGFDFVNGDSHANDDNFHGTHVASTIAEATNNGVGVAGLAFGCALMPVKVLDDEGDGSFFIIAEGIDFAVRNPNVKVINLSLGGDSTSESVRRAVDAAEAAGVTVVAAAGNESRGTVSFPANLPNVIAVGAVDGRKQKAPYSNTGSTLDIMAPGGDLRRDDTGPDLRPDGRPDGVLQQTFDPDTAAATGRYDDFAYFFVVGTSQATPHVSALAALLVRQGITQPSAVRKVIEQTAEDLGATGRDDTFGHGLIRPVQALTGLGLNR